MKNLNTFILDNRISLTSEKAGHNPYMDKEYVGDHYKVILKRPGHRMTAYFSKGYGHNGEPPTVGEVLGCLHSDSLNLDNGFEAWAWDLGYDPDSRRAYTVYQNCKKLADKLEHFLGCNWQDFLDLDMD